jgi:hypothetical protein
LKHEDVFEDDVTISAETMVYYAKRENIVLTLYIGISMVVVCVYMYLESEYIVSLLVLIASIYFFYRQYKIITNIEPQITISNKGIKTISTKFYNWSDIKNEGVVVIEDIEKLGGKFEYHYLTYDYPGGAERLKIEGYDTNQTKLNKLLFLYRMRSNVQDFK